jgi:uncharacterized sulfatase
MRQCRAAAGSVHHAEMIRFLTILAFLAAVAPAFCAEKRNVLFIAVDDMNNALGCYGHPLVKSPHLDKLASRGVKFDRAYCQFPLCSPSRSSLMTGLLPDKTTVYDLQLHFRRKLPDVVTLGQFFQKQGYFSARVGKIYHYGNPGQIGTPGLDDPPTWNVALNPRGRDKDEENLLTNHTPKRGLGSSLSFLAAEGGDEEQTDGKVATETIRLMEENRDRPFFIAAGFYRPHCPYIAPKKYFDMYPLEKIKLPEYSREAARSAPPAALASTSPWPWMGVSDQQAREAIRAYYAAISFVDAQVGRLLDALDRLALTEKTLIVFWSDHGYHLGEHGLVFKMSLFEESARVPLIIAGPGVKAGGKASPRTVELLDLYPTCADMSGHGIPAGLHGRSLRPLLEDAAAPWDRPALSQVQRGGKKGSGPFMGYSLRDERYRFVQWGPDGREGVQLFDHSSDPKEEKDLSADSASASTLAKFRRMLQERLAMRQQQ